MPLTLKAFLSHRYQSPAVNTYFHKVFSDAAELQFDVDAATGSTNVTRLERMVRDADAFVGIYPYDDEGVERPTRQQLLEASRYFRLELDLAARARTPAIIFIDQRYGPVIGLPASMFVCPFDHQEILGRGGSPSREGFRRTFQRFCENVEASMQYERTRPQPQPVGRSVGILLPPAAYDQAVLQDLESKIFNKLDRSAVAVPMLSASYVASGNCLHEARSIVAARDSGKIKVVPVKLVRGDLQLPPFLTDIQYIRAWEQSDPESMVERIVKALR